MEPKQLKTTEMNFSCNITARDPKCVCHTTLKITLKEKVQSIPQLHVTEYYQL